MFKSKCDICGETQIPINTLILYKKKIDYCNNKKCIKKILNIEKQFRREIYCQNVLFDSALRSEEKEILKNIKKVLNY